MSKRKEKVFLKNSERGLTKRAECGIILYAKRKGAKSLRASELAGVAEQADARDLKSRDT